MKQKIQCELNNPSSVFMISWKACSYLPLHPVLFLHSSYPDVFCPPLPFTCSLDFQVHRGTQEPYSWHGSWAGNFSISAYLLFHLTILVIWPLSYYLLQLCSWTRTTQKSVLTSANLGVHWVCFGRITICTFIYRLHAHWLLLQLCHYVIYFHWKP